MQAKRPWLAYGLLAIWALIVLWPLIDMFLLSFKDLAGIIGNPLGLPTQWNFSNYVQAWTQGNLLVYLINTAIVSLLSVTAILFLSSMAAYVIARFHFPGNQFVYLFFLSGLALPIQMIAIPVFILMRDLGLVDNFLSVILIYVGSGMSFSVFLLVNFIRHIPLDLEEAAFLDGASHFQIYWRIILPLIRPSLGTVGLLNFITAWNGFFFPLILLSDPNQMTVAVGVLSFIGEYAAQWNLLLPALIIVSLPTVVVFIIASRQFIRNMTAGAIKL